MSFAVELPRGMGESEMTAPGDPTSAPDLIILVRSVQQYGTYSLLYQVYSRDLRLGRIYEEFGPVALREPPFEYFQRFFREIESLSGKTDSRGSVAARRLCAKAGALSRELIPQGLARRLWAIREEAQSVQILSDEPWIPWELLRIEVLDAGKRVVGPFLVETFEVTRWLVGVREITYLPLRRIGLTVASGSGLEEAKREKRFFFSLRDRGLEVAEIPATYSAISESLSQGQLECWHFIGHGLVRGESPGNWAILLDGREVFTPDDLSSDAWNIGKASPLVFLNACHSGWSNVSLSGIGGWASQLLQAGVGAFIGPIWAVEDLKARIFAETFYESFLRGSSLGAAARCARLKVKNLFPGDPSWLAYAVFGHPLAVGQRNGRRASEEAVPREDYGVASSVDVTGDVRATSEEKAGLPPSIGTEPQVEDMTPHQVPRARLVLRWGLAVLAVGALFFFGALLSERSGAVKGSRDTADRGGGTDLLVGTESGPQCVAPPTSIPSSQLGMGAPRDLASGEQTPSSPERLRPSIYRGLDGEFHVQWEREIEGQPSMGLSEALIPYQ